MNEIEDVREAQEVEELAERIEPLAQAMAKLADDLAEHIAEVDGVMMQQKITWDRQQEKAEELWEKATEQVSQATETLKENMAQRDQLFSVRFWISVLIIAVIAALPGVFMAYQLRSLETRLERAEKRNAYLMEKVDPVLMSTITPKK